MNTVKRNNDKAMVGNRLGERLRAIRTQRGMTLDAIATDVGLTKGYLSLVENGHKVPTIATLVKLASALDVPISVLFEEKPLQGPVTIVRKAERKPFEPVSSHGDYHYESISYKAGNKHMEAFIMVPPATDEEPGQLYDHEGEELIFVISGIVELILADCRYILRKGDCCYLDSSIPHTYRSPRGKVAECLTVIYPAYHEPDQKTRKRRPTRNVFS